MLLRPVTLPAQRRQDVSPLILSSSLALMKLCVVHPYHPFVFPFSTIVVSLRRPKITCFRDKFHFGKENA